MSHRNCCPDSQSYSRLASGQLSEEEKEALLAHLEVCPACSTRVDGQLRMDTLVDLVRQAQAVVAPNNAVADLIERMSRLRPDMPTPEDAEQAEQMVTQDLSAPNEPELERLSAFLAAPQANGELGRLGPYRVLQVLGVGGMGIVFRAEDTQLMRAVALKAMRPVLAASDSARQRFLREARAMAAVKHDHIVSVYQVGEEGGIPFLAMEFLEGEPLNARLQREGKLPAAEVVRIGREIALGLAAAHKRGLIHRDIKPANIWLEVETGRVRILDFGLVHAAGAGEQLTQLGTIVGTPAYMAPEQARGKDVDARCDLFSLGCVLYRMATGQAAFRGIDLVSTLMAVNTHTPPPPHKLDAALPASLSKLIVGLLAKDVRERPASAQVVADALEGIARELVAGPLAAKPRKKRLIAAGVFACLLLVGFMVLSFRLKTKDGTIVLEDLPADTEVFVEGTTAKVNYGPDGKWIEVHIAAGERKLRIKAAGFEVKTEDVILAAGERKAIRLRLEPVKAVVPAAAPAKADREPAFFDGGVWRMAGAELVQAKAGRSVLMFGDTSWTDYDVSFETKTMPGAKGGQGGNLFFRVKTPGDHLTFSPGAYGGTWTETFRMENGRWTRDVPPLRMAYKVDRWYKVLVQVRGSHIHCWLDGRELFNFKDAHFANGHIGLGTWNSAVRWKDLKATTPAGRVLWEGFPVLPTSTTPPVDEAWLKSVAALPPEKQVEAVTRKLRELNPGFDSEVTHRVEDGAVTEIQFLTDQVTDLSPLRALTGLRRLTCAGHWEKRGLLIDLSPLKDMKLQALNCHDTGVADLSPLKGMPLTEVACSGTPVSDLSPLKDMKLTWFRCDLTKVSDLSPLRDMPLQELWCDFKPEGDSAIVRAIKTLKTINGKPAAEFWKEMAEKKPAAAIPSSPGP